MNRVADFYERTAAFYDHIVHYQNRQDVDFFVEAAVASGGPVLEIGCGTGRILIPTARAGIAITGLDRSPAMLDVCRNALDEEPEDVQARVTLVEADMRAFEIDGKFALVTLPFRPFQHLLEVDEQIACLTNIHRHLRPGGRVIVDLFNPMLERLTDEKYLVEFEPEPEVTLPDGRRMVRSGRLVSRDLARQVLEIEFRHDITLTDGRTEVHSEQVPLRYFFRYEVEHLLACCGFEVEALYSDYDKKPFGAVWPGELLFVARRR